MLLLVRTAPQPALTRLPNSQRRPQAICRSIGVFSEAEALNGNSMTGLAFAGLPEAGALPWPPS